MELPAPFISILLPSAVQTSFQSWKWEVIQFCFSVIGVFLEDWSLLLLLCDIAGCRHSVSGPPRLEELHPRILVQWLWHGADSRELLQAKQTHFIFLAPFRSRVVYNNDYSHMCAYTHTHTLYSLLLIIRWGIASGVNGVMSRPNSFHSGECCQNTSDWNTENEQQAWWNSQLCLFSTCKDNRGIYSALRLDKVFNVSSFLNTTMVSILAVQLYVC